MIIARVISRPSRLLYRYYATISVSSSATTPPPMLLKIRKDMKAALQAKDSNRLSVLRSLLTETLNASKTTTPINTDLQMLALLRKTAGESRAARAEFQGAGREDLAEKEDTQLRIIEEYAGTVETVGREEIMNAVKDVVDQMKSNGINIQMGEVIKRVLAVESLGGKPVEKGEVAKVVKQYLSSGNL